MRLVNLWTIRIYPENVSDGNRVLCLVCGRGSQALLVLVGGTLSQNLGLCTLPVSLSSQQTGIYTVSLF